MELGVVLTYSDIFDEPKLTIEQLMSSVSSEVAITILSVINAQLYLDQSLKGQIRLLEFILFRQDAKTKNHITGKLAGALASSEVKSVSLFSTQFNLEFIHYELIHYRVVDKPDTEVEDELNFFKTYLLIAERVANELYAIPTTESDDPFQSRLWPIVIRQYQLMRFVDPSLELPKSIAFFNYFESHPEYRPFVRQFLKKYSKETSWNYILDISNLITTSLIANKDNPTKLFPFFITATEGYEALLHHLTLDINEYQLHYKNKKIGFKGLKETPLFKTKTGSFVVVSFNLLALKIYDGLVFDFYKHSNIHTLERFSKFLLYKNEVATEIIEKFLFQRLVVNCFPKKHTVQIFEGNKEGYPDGYVRQGKYVYLFEVKDALFPADVLDNPSYSSIKETIDTKYNNPKKGTGQLINQLTYLKDQTFETISFEDLKIKRRNLTVYPIIIYTDKNFGLPGINRYLVNEFKERVMNNQLDKEFGVIKPLTFCSLSFLSDNVDIFQGTKYTLKSAIEHFHHYRKVQEEKFKKHPTVEHSLAIHDPIEDVFERQHKIDREDRNYVECTIKLFGLLENLPKA